MKKRVSSLVLSFVLVFTMLFANYSEVKAESFDKSLALNGQWTEKYYLDDGDRQYFKINVPSAGKVTVKIQSYFDGLNFDLLSADKMTRLSQEPIRDGTPSSPVGSSSTFDLSKGTYYVAISDLFDGSRYNEEIVRGYRLSAKFSSFKATDGKADSYDSPQRLKLGKQEVGAMTMTDGEDWYVFKAATKGDYTLRLLDGRDIYADYTVYNSDLTETVSWPYTSVNSNIHTEKLNLKKGTYYIKVTSYYTGRYKLLVKPNIAKGKNLSVKKRSGSSLNVKYSKLSGATQYEVQLATKRNMKSGLKTKNTKSTSFAWKGLKKNRTYYVRVRGVYKDGSTKINGSWSSVRKITLR